MQKTKKNYYTDSCEVNVYITELCFGWTLENTQTPCLITDLRMLWLTSIIYDLHVPSYCTLGKAIEPGSNIITTH